MAHCGGDVRSAVRFLADAIASAPEEDEPYTVLADLHRDRRAEITEIVQDAATMDTVLARSFISFLEDDMDDAAMAIGSVTGVQPTVAWARAPWFGGERFLGAVSAGALAEAAMRTTDHGHDLDSDAMRERLRPWFHALDVVSARRPVPEALARMAIFLRACGRTGASFAFCDRADAIERIMLTEVVRAGTWRKLGDPAQTAAAFERALAPDPSNWSLCLDLADTRAELGDYAAAVRLVARGLEHEPDEITLRAAGAAYRARLHGSAADLGELVRLAPRVPDDAYRDLLIDRACDAHGLPADLVAAARRIQRE
ncbi:tetratricopeptide repeat protein [Actinomadura sp. KC216]|nr:tetratricopeptide repeat protein [Actinomadura sp. KC216]